MTDTCSTNISPVHVFSTNVQFNCVSSRELAAARIREVSLRGGHRESAHVVDADSKVAAINDRDRELLLLPPPLRRRVYPADELALLASESTQLVEVLSSYLSEVYPQADFSSLVARPGRFEPTPRDRPVRNLIRFVVVCLPFQPPFIVSCDRYGGKPSKANSKTMLTAVQPSLRTFPLDGDLISTFEQDSSCDPTVVKLTATDPKLYKYDVLFPELLPLPLRRNPVPSESRPPSTDPIRGFPIRWSSVELPWLAYLPVVVTYHYPIFTSMNRSPDTEPDRGKFKLSQCVIDHWSNVESVMDSTIRKLQGMATVCWHHPPSYPASYGYRRPFNKRRDAKVIIKNSLLAFQHMLAYCSYMFASIETPRASRDQRTLYEDSSRISTLYRDTEDNGNRGGSHILLKHLWSSLNEVRRTRNFIGVVITHDQRYDCRSVEVMRSYGVPIYVRWSSHLRLESYRNFPQGDALASWRPSIDSFATLDLPQRSANFHPSVSSVQQPPSPLPPVALDQYADGYPWKYVEERRAHIESNPTKPESWLGRERSAKSFSPPGSRGARTYRFTSIGTIEESTGREISKWERTMLSRAQAQTLWNGVDPRKLW
jgi:hypothetical protein